MFSKIHPIFAHNSSRYDSHFLIKELNKIDNDEIQVIPKTDEEYISVSKYYEFDDEKIEIRFLDSIKFLPASLDELSSNLLENGKEEFKNLMLNTTKNEQDNIFWVEEKSFIKHETHINSNFNVNFKKLSEVVKIPRIKGIFPYDYIDSFEKYNETNIPSDENFYNKLKLEHITQQEKAQFLKVWNSIESPSLGKYSDLYLKTDVLILADVFENFRKISLEYYKLDPVNFFTTASLSWQAMLSKTNVNLDLLTDIDMYTLFENGIRGGISQVCGDRYVDVSDKNFISNKNINKDDENQEWLHYFDANNLYGHSMSQKLPFGRFKWMTEKDIIDFKDKLFNEKITGDEFEGYLLEVNIKYPDNKEDFINLPINK